MEHLVPPLEAREVVRLLENMPMGLLLEDKASRVVWTNKALADFLGETSKDLLGRRVDDLPLTRLPGVGGKADFLQIDHPPARGPQWLTCTRQVLSQHSDKTLFVRFYLDATEHRRTQLLRNPHLQLQQGAGFLEPVTGTLARLGITQTLQSEVSRSRRYHNPLAIICMLVAACSDARKQPTDPDRVMAAAARLLKEQTRWVDIIGRWSEWEFLLVLPESSARAARRLVEKIERHLMDSGALSLPKGLPCFTARFGLAQWQQDDDASSLLERARADLKVG